MSGIEVAGLVVGVLPLLIEALKSYAAVTEGLHTFRHYSREVKSISRQFETQNCIFLNHCRLLLRLIEDEKDAEAMLDNDSDERWWSTTQDEKMRTALKDSYEMCQGVVEETKDVVEDIRSMMGEFDILRMQKKEDENISTTIKRLRKAVKIAFCKNKYDKHIASLRDRNDDLNVLRSQISAFQQTATMTNSLAKHDTFPNRFQSIQNASRKLHEALCSAWCCDDTAHRNHYAKLCLQANVETEVRLHLAISCQDITSSKDDQLAQESPIWLYVQSMSVAGSAHELTATQEVKHIKESTKLGDTISPKKKLKKKASNDLESMVPGRKKKKRVHFDDITQYNDVQAIPPQIFSSEINLCQTKDICHYLQRNYQECRGSIMQDCIGYLETPCHMYKHKFYLRDKSLVGSTRRALPEVSTVYSIFDVMQYDAEDAVQPEDQLRLALEAASAILQYHDTPWLTPQWRLDNISYFGAPNNFDEGALQTLHLSSQLSSSGHSNSDSVVMEGIQDNTSKVNDEDRYGINNLPLFFLGVALLEIAHWKPLEKSMGGLNQNDHVVTARQLARRRAPLGPEYQKIVRKCLECNFGFGTKLSNKSLQNAVYNDVVCGLEGMIKRLAI